MVEIPFYPIDAQAEARAWLQLRVTPEGAHGPRILLQNELAKRLRGLRNELETAPVAEIPELQARVRATRNLFAFLSSKDTTKI